MNSKYSVVPEVHSDGNGNLYSFICVLSRVREILL